MNADPIGQVGPLGLGVLQPAASPIAVVFDPAMELTPLQGLKEVAPIHQELRRALNVVIAHFNDFVRVLLAGGVNGVNSHHVMLRVEKEFNVEFDCAIDHHHRVEVCLVRASILNKLVFISVLPSCLITTVIHLISQNLRFAVEVSFF